MSHNQRTVLYLFFIWVATLTMNTIALWVSVLNPQFKTEHFLSALIVSVAVALLGSVFIITRKHKEPKE